MIRANNLVKRFRGHEALRGLNLTVADGSAYALIGSNGAGKTTAIRILMNLVEATSGTATVMGVDSRAISTGELCRIGFVAESMRMPEGLSVSQYLDYLRPFYGPAWDRDLEISLLRRMRVPRNWPIGHLSHGMRMKFALVCALAFRPRLLVLDEPLSGLDPLSRDEFIQGLSEQAGELTILISSHEMNEIEGLLTHVGFIEDGRMLFEEPMTGIAGRFRQVCVTLAREAVRPADAPAEWMDLRTAGNVLTFVDTRFSESGLGERVRAVLEEVRAIDTEPMSLRSIFTAMARQAAGRRAIAMGGE
jgi:ABC-2 type transport system ATP-binding protein